MTTDPTECESRRAAGNKTRPAVRLVPVPTDSSLASVRGAWRGRVHIEEDFDALPPDMAEAFGAE